jgi:hypothetical protein
MKCLQNRRIQPKPHDERFGAMTSRAKGARRPMPVQGGGIGGSGFVRNYSSREQVVLILSSSFILTLLLGVQLYLGFRMNNIGIADDPQLFSHLDKGLGPAQDAEGAAGNLTPPPPKRDWSPIVRLIGEGNGDQTDKKVGPELGPIFRCATKPTFRQNKLIFVHVFKTAGSTIRNFFDAYSDWCFAGWAIIVGCATVDVDTIGSNRRKLFSHDDEPTAHSNVGDIWNATNPIPGEPPCCLKRTWNRTGSKRWEMDVENRYVAQELDIIGGHLPLGVEDVWKNTTYLSSEVQDSIGVMYLTFIRNAVDKLVSGTSYKTKNPTIDGVVDKIRTDVEQYLARGEYQAKYGEYFITPRQKKEYARREVTLTAEESTIEQMANLLEYNVVVGATERMSDSLHLLQSLIDKDGEATELFEEFGMVSSDVVSNQTKAKKDKPKLTEGMKKRAEDFDGGGNKDDGEVPLVINPSRLSTRAIVQKLKEDDKLFLDVLEFVRYEQQITDFALALHLRQFKKAGPR